MEQLRKIGAWCWETKERLVLALMVILLGYRVYSLVYTPNADEPEPIPPNPGRVYAEDLKVPPPLPAPYNMDPPNRLRRNNPFIFVPPRAGGRSLGAGAELEDEIRVLRIFESGNGTYKAQITTGAAKKLIPEGEKFESYQLISIDPITQCCEIYSESLGELIERCVEEN